MHNGDTYFIRFLIYKFIRLWICDKNIKRNKIINKSQEFFNE